MGIPTQFENYIHRTGRTGRAGSKGTSLSLVGHKESRILLAWARRGGLNLEWRAVPSPSEIRKERSRRLGDKVRGHEARAFEDLAEALLEDREPTGLVAALLSLIEDDAHLGFDMPETIEPKRHRPFGDRDGQEGPWKRGGGRGRRQDWAAEDPRDKYRGRDRAKYRDRPADRPKERHWERDEPREWEKPWSKDRAADKPVDRQADRPRSKFFEHPDDRPKAYGAKKGSRTEWQDAPPARSRKSAADDPEGPPKRAAARKYEYSDPPPKRSYTRKHDEQDPPPKRSYTRKYDEPVGAAKKTVKKKDAEKPAKKVGKFNPPWPIPGGRGRKK
jgi:superfamily II DNA/RNA helicase